MSKRSLFISTAITLIVTVFSFAVAQSSPYGEKIENPSPYSELLPDNYRATILTADSIEWMLIDGWSLNDSLIFSLGEPIGEILLQKLSNDSVAVEQVKNLLLAPTSFKNDSIIKECTYIPDFGILFKSGTDSLVVSYSSYCDICRFQTDKDYYEFDGSLVRDELFLIFKKEFPKDKYVRNLTRRL